MTEGGIVHLPLIPQRQLLVHRRGQERGVQIRLHVECGRCPLQVLHAIHSVCAVLLMPVLARALMPWAFLAALWADAVLGWLVLLEGFSTPCAQDRRRANPDIHLVSVVVTLH